MHDNLPWFIGIPMAIVLWAIVYKIYIWPSQKLKIDNFFAQRRHNRRMKKIDLALKTWEKADSEVYIPSRPRHLARR